MSLKKAISLCGVIVFAAVIIFSMASCDNPTDLSEGPPKVVNIDTIQGVTAPIAGKIPVTTITETAQYTGTVTWYDNWYNTSIVFAAEISYTAEITLYPKPGYTLQGVRANFFKVKGAQTYNDANSGVVRAVFPETAAPVVEYRFGDLAGAMNFAFPSTGITLDAWCMVMNGNTNYAQSLETGSLPAPLYRNKALTSPFSGGDTLQAGTSIFCAFNLLDVVLRSSGSEQRAITINGLDFFNNGDIKVSLFSDDGYSVNSEPAYWGNGYIYGGTVTVTLYGQSDYYLNAWYGNGQYYVSFRIGNYGNYLFYRSTVPVTFSNSNPNPAINFSDFTFDSSNDSGPVDFLTLTADVWADDSISVSDGVHWFKFTATASTQYLHVSLGTLTALYVQLYDSGNSPVESQTLFSSSNSKYTSRTLMVGQEYYIKVWTNHDDGAYQIAFNTVFVPPTNVITADVWANGNIPAEDGEQWFKFTATADTQYIHARFGTLTNLYVQVYDSNGNSLGLVNLYGDITYTSVFLAAGREYYIKVWPSHYGLYGSSYKGAYKIAFNTSPETSAIVTMSPSGVSQLTVNTWADSNISASGAMQWFKFTATADTHYIHARFGTLNPWDGGLCVQVYDSDRFLVGSEARLNNDRSYTNSYTPVSLTAGQEYYIEAWSYYDQGTGTYQILVNTSAVPLSDSADIIQLNAGVWTDGNIPTSGCQQWFKFTATTALQYIYFNLDTLTNLYVQVYDSDGNTIINYANFINRSSYTSRTVTVGQEYYIKVWPSNREYSGTYQIAFKFTATPTFGIELPSDATTLTVDTWADGTVSTPGNEQWFKFTATAVTQYIHSLETGFYIQVYDADGNTVGAEVYFTTNQYNQSLYSSRTLIKGCDYYIKLWPVYSSVSKKIAFNASTTAPTAPVVHPWTGATVTRLTVNTWADGDIPVSGKQWFSFSETAWTQYIHVILGTMTKMYVSVYDSDGKWLGPSATFDNSSGTYTSKSALNSGKTYYIEVSPLAGSNGTYRIAFNASTLSPDIYNTATRLTVNTWADGDISAEGGEQWFRFTATDTAQYLHADFDTLTDLDIQLYNTNGDTFGNRIRLNSGARYTSLALTTRQDYFIKVTPYSSSSRGTYRIKFNTVFVPPVSPTALTAGIWTEDSITASYGERWYKFTASAGTQYLHAGFNTLTDPYVQVYDLGGYTVSQINLNSDSRYVSMALTTGQEYFIKVTPYSSSSIGAYRIAFNTSATPPPPSNAAAVTAITAANAWANGTSASGGVQWFKFTTTASAQYIHVNFNTLTDLYIQLYSGSGDTVESQTRLSGSTTYVSRSLMTGQEYYIKVWPYSSSGSGTYQIAFNTSMLSPASINRAVQLTANEWNSSSGSEQWFKFTATAAVQYLHAGFNTSINLSVQVYDPVGTAVGSPASINSSAKYTLLALTTGQLYYIKVSGSGSYRMTFNTSLFPPTTALTANTWANVSIPSNDGERWFKFNATTAVQYLHISFGTTLTDLNIQLYNNDGTVYGSQTSLNSYNYTTYTTLNLTNGQEYYIKVWPNSSSSGTYRIAFNTSTTPPADVTLPPSATQLFYNNWSNGNASTSYEWFKFTATATTQYIHVSFGTLTDLSVQVYDSRGIMSGSPEGLSGNSGSTAYTSRNLGTGQVYYIRVGASGSSGGTYQIAFNTCKLSPTIINNATQLTVGYWASNTSNEWYKFTASLNVTTHYIHAQFVFYGDTVSIQIYDSGGDQVTSLSLSSYKEYESVTLTSGQEYYMRAVTNRGYKIGINERTQEPYNP